jgi:hypothetical protein
MRNPILLQNARFLIKHNSDLGLEENECHSCSSKYTNDKSYRVFINQDFEIKPPTSNQIINNNLKWASDLEINNTEIAFEICKIPNDKYEIYEELQSSMVEKSSEITDTNIIMEKTDTEILKPNIANMIHPIIDQNLFVKILKSINFEENANAFFREDIGELQIKDNLDINFKQDFDIKKINEDIKEEFKDNGSSWYEDLTNPYEDIFSFESISPFFYKHKENATSFWENYSSRIFTHNPLRQQDKSLKPLIDNTADRFEYLELWVDLMKSISFETINLRDQTIASEFKDVVSRCNHSHREDIIIPWNSKIYSTLIEKQKILDYNTSDFDYNRNELHKNMKFRVPKDDNISYIYESKNYGKYGELNGTLLPMGWLARPIGVTVTNPEKEYYIEKMYEKLENLPSSVYITKDEIENHSICMESELKPVIRNDGHHNKIQKLIDEKNSYKHRIKESVYEGYKMKNINLVDFIEFNNYIWSDGYHGWHTGTICSEFPFKAKLGEPNHTYKKYEDFNNSGSISFKSSEKIHIKPNWNSILDQSVENLEDEKIKEKIVQSNYDLQNKIVITFHKLP